MRRFDKDILLGAFAFLLLAKIVLPFRTAAGLGSASLYAGVLYAIIFGSAQIAAIVWLRARRTDDGASVVGAIMAAAFVIIYVTCGFFPWSEGPSWGGEAHFEVPLCLVMEWMAFGLCAVGYRMLAGPEDAS